MSICESMMVKPVSGIFSFRPNSEYCWMKRTASAPGMKSYVTGGLIDLMSVR